ncbi:MAG: hypothetical protein WC175_04445 [Candidatus Dojkabacteria bacterium]|jgi:hypothetical protein
MGGTCFPPSASADEILKEKSKMFDKPKNLIKTTLVGKTSLPFILLGLTKDKKQFEIFETKNAGLKVPQTIHYSIGGPVYIDTAYQGWVQIGRLFEPDETWQTLSQKRMEEWKASQKPFSEEPPKYPSYELKGSRKDFPALLKAYGEGQALAYASKFNMEDSCKNFTFPAKVFFVRDKIVVVPWVENNATYHSKPIYAVTPEKYSALPEEERKKIFEALCDWYNGVIKVK